ncbi:transposase [Yoonia sp.]|uniref:transposase n=1 Tax=Yoonia sp. TaxID=2212373 RepID=UPI0025F5C5C8|nr:transposase [Yoonia sp.]
MGYSPERKAAVLKRMLPPDNMAIRQLAQEEGISEATLHKWQAEARGKGQLMPDADAGPEGWSSRDKFAAVLETQPHQTPFLITLGVILSMGLWTIAAVLGYLRLAMTAYALDHVFKWIGRVRRS